MITPPKPGQALDLYMSWDDWLPAATPWPPKLHESADPLELQRSRSLESYEFRPSSYLAIISVPPMRHFVLSTDPGYWTDFDTELDWEDRANADGGSPDWWDAEWVRAAWRAGLGPQEDFDDDE